MSTIKCDNVIVGRNDESRYLYLTNVEYVNRLKTGAFNENIYLNTTRTALSQVATRDLWQVTFNKLSSTSIIVAEGVLHFREQQNGHVGMFIRYGTSSNTFTGNPYMTMGENSAGSTDASVDNIQYIASYISGYTTTGAQTFTIGWSSYNGSANYPSTVWNPNSSDEPRTRPDSGSIIRIWEVEP